MPAGMARRPWQIRCAIDSAKALLPFQNTLRRLKDRAVGYQRNITQDALTIRDGLTLVNRLGDLRGVRVLEVGSGWQPMLPILFSLAGASVFTTDLHRLIRLDTFRAALEAIRESRAVILDGLGFPAIELDHATRPCNDLDARLAELRITYLAPCDCRALPLDAGSIDVVTSRAVLEHVPPAVIAAIFVEARRVVGPGGRMIHLVDHSDHWAHRDPRITPVNFLQYPDWLFRWTCIHPQNYQNRLRHSEYVRMVTEAGFALRREEQRVNEACLTAVRQMRIDARFAHFDERDLATTSSLLLAEVG